MYNGCIRVDTRIIVYYACIVVYSCISPCSPKKKGPKKSPKKKKACISAVSYIGDVSGVLAMYWCSIRSRVCADTVLMCMMCISRCIAPVSRRVSRY